jgi:ssDNA-binding replication factor A large subunit
MIEDMVERVDEIFQALLRAGISEDELMAQVKEKETEFQGFMTKQAILYLIAKENGVNVDSSENTEMLEHIANEVIDYNDFAIPISEITEGMNNIVITGRVTEIHEKREFVKKDGTPGTVNSFYICDLSECIKVVLWDEQIEIMENKFFQLQEIIQVIGAYSKKGLNSNLELHLGRQGKLVLAPKGVNLPEVEQEKKSNPIEEKKKSTPLKISIKELYSKEGFIRFVNGIVQIHSFKEFSKKNGEKSFLLKLILSDDSSSITVNIWDLKAVQFIKLIENGVSIKLINVVVKENSYSNEKELSSTKNTHIELI